MSTTLEDIVDDAVTPAHVAKRADDWERRLVDLYTLLESWLPPGWTARRSRTIPMHEELMRQVGLGERQIPALDLIGQGEVRATADPRALWIVGVNGRVDLYTPKGAFFIFDVANSFAPPEWQVVSAQNRMQREPLSRDWFKSVLG